MSLPVPPDHLPFTGDPDADALIATNPLALLIGFALDQQVTVQKAFSGPLELQRRAVPLDAAAIAAMDPEALATIFRTPPALHRFPGNMARPRPGPVRADRVGLRRRRVADLDGGGRREGPRRATPRAARHRRDEGRDDPHAARDPLRDQARGLGGGPPEDADARAMSTPPRRSPSTRPASGRARPRHARPRARPDGPSRRSWRSPQLTGILMALAPSLQIRRMFQTHSSRDLSIGYLALLDLGFVIWISYGFSIGNWALIISNAASLAFMTITILVALCFRRAGSHAGESLAEPVADAETAAPRS